MKTGVILSCVGVLAMLGGAVHDRLFFFDGVLRLTEGETLPTDRAESYDRLERGALFDLSRLPGETRLVAVHADAAASAEHREPECEVAVSAGDALVRRRISASRTLDFEGTRFACQGRGTSVLLVLSDREGRELSGAHVPLRSVERPGSGPIHALGTDEGEPPFPLPPPPERPRAEVRLSFRPSPVSGRQGEVTLDVRPLGPDGRPLAHRTGAVPVGGAFDAGEVMLAPREIRYWASLGVRHHPGRGSILAGLCLLGAGLATALFGRAQGARAARAASRSERTAPRPERTSPTRSSGGS
jgi:hypothetical protein